MPFVLVVESEKSVRISISTLIQGMPGPPIQVEEASNVTEALNCLENRLQTDLMITSNVDLIEAARRVVPSLKIIVMSNLVSEQASKVYAYLPKPFMAQALVSLAEGIFRKN